MNGMPLAPSVVVWRLYWFLHRQAEEERGSVATEYGLLLALIALALVAAAVYSGWRSPTCSIRAGPASLEPGPTPPARPDPLEPPMARRLRRSGGGSHAVTGAM